MSLLNEDDIRKAIDDKPDSRGKFLLTSKSIIAQFLKFLLPKQFEEMSISEIVEFCFEGDTKNPFIELLSEEKNEAGGNKYINDLVFKIKLPKPLKISGHEFSELLINIEPQNSDPTTYILDIRGIIYASKHFLNENAYLDLKKTIDMYQNAVPVLVIWINTNPKEKKSEIKYGSFNWNNSFSYAENKFYELKNEDSMFNIISINLGEDIDLNKKDLFSYLYILLINNNDQEVINTLYDYGILKKGESEMFITPVEQKWFNDGEASGIKKGEAQGIKKGEAQGIKKGEAQGIKKGEAQGIKKGEANIFNKFVNNILKQNPNISKDEAIEQAKLLIGLEETPELP